MFHWEPKGGYCCTKSMAIAPFWFSTEHLWFAIAPFWLSTDDMFTFLTVFSRKNNNLKDKILASVWRRFEYRTVRAEIFAVVLFSQISRVKPSRKFPLQFMSIYSNNNISKIAKLTRRELPHLAKTAKITVRENNGVYSNPLWIIEWCNLIYKY